MRDGLARRAPGPQPARYVRCLCRWDSVSRTLPYLSRFDWHSLPRQTEYEFILAIEQDRPARQSVRQIGAATQSSAETFQSRNESRELTGSGHRAFRHRGIRWCDATGRRSGESRGRTRTAFILTGGAGRAQDRIIAAVGPSERQVGWTRPAPRGPAQWPRECRSGLRFRKRRAARLTSESAQAGWRAFQLHDGAPAVPRTWHFDGNRCHFGRGTAVRSN